MTPEAAVEAAAKALWAPSEPTSTWETEHKVYKLHLRDEALNALHAAVPEIERFLDTHYPCGCDEGAYCAGNTDEAWTLAQTVLSSVARRLMEQAWEAAYGRGFRDSTSGAAADRPNPYWESGRCSC